LNNFLDLGGSGSPGRPSQLPAGGGGAAGDFLQNRPADRPSAGDRSDIRQDNQSGRQEGISDNRSGRQDNVADNRSGRQDNVADNRSGRQDNVADNRSGRQDNVSDNRSDRRDNLSDNRAGRVDNVQQRTTDRVDRRNEVRQQVRRSPPRSNFWGSNRYAARWTRPYRWATWGAITSWFPWGWSQPTSYSYGDNVYVEGDSVYYGDDAVATEQQYGEQAFAIAAGAEQVEATDDSDWMTLGVFAMTQDGQASGPAPNLFLQLAVSKEGLIAGTYFNQSTDQSHEIQGVVDKKTQRTAWTVGGEDWPVMETGISNLTEDEAPALIHFAEGQTQQWLLVRLEDPDA
jgi:hypothetical protein